MGTRALPPRPYSVTPDISGWRVIGWRYYRENVWACKIIQPDGSVYSPPAVGGGTIRKVPGTDTFIVNGYSETNAKKRLRDFIVGIQFEEDRKAREPEDFVFDESQDLVATKKVSSTPKFDVSAKEFDEALGRVSGHLNEFAGGSEPAPSTSEKKSLWQSWKEKRADKRVQEQDINSSEDSGRAED